MFKIKIIVCGWQRLVWTSHKYSGRDGVNQQLGRGRISDGGNYPQICPHRALATSSVKIKHRFSLQLTFIHPTAPLYVHPLNCCQKINNCFVLSTEKGNTYQPKSCYSMWQWSIFLRDLQLPYSVSCFVSFTKLNGWSPKFSQRFLNMFLRLSTSASALLG